MFNVASACYEVFFSNGEFYSLLFRKFIGFLLYISNTANSFKNLLKFMKNNLLIKSTRLDKIKNLKDIL